MVPAELSSRGSLDHVTGGPWRGVHVDGDGNEYAFRGVYHVRAARRLVLTFEFEGTPGHVCLKTPTFDAVADGTKVTQHTPCSSPSPTAMG